MQAAHSVLLPVCVSKLLVHKQYLDKFVINMLSFQSRNILMVIGKLEQNFAKLNKIKCISALSDILQSYNDTCTNAIFHIDYFTV